LIKTRVTPLKANLKKKEARFLTKQILRDEIEGNKSIKKKQCKTKQIIIKRIRTKFNIKQTEIKCLGMKLKKTNQLRK
jgi:hypothetical protein